MNDQKNVFQTTYTKRAEVEAGLACRQATATVEQIPQIVAQINAVLGLAEDGVVQISQRIEPVLRRADKNAASAVGTDSDSYGIPLADDLANMLMRIRAIQHAQLDLLERIAL